jgi:hypothetical protein
MRWTKAQAQSAVALWLGGETAKAIGWRFGCSRSAVLGKLRRMGVPKRRELAVRALNDPNYRYSPWTPERRKAASEASKRRWAERRAAEQAEFERQQRGLVGQLRSRRYAKAREMDELAQRWRVAKAAAEEMDQALKLVDEISPILRKHGIAGEIT